MSDKFAATRGGGERKFFVQPGQRFDRLVVLGEFKESGTWRARCMCDCGKATTVRLHNLKGGLVRSCGCLQSDRAAESGADRATHAMSRNKHYARWSNMMKRCYDPTNRSYHRWGGRGILVCQEWHDPVVFIAYLEATLGPRPEGHSLDRIDNDGNYEPGNVRWADPLTQRHNQRRSARR